MVVKGEKDYFQISEIKLSRDTLGQFNECKVNSPDSDHINQEVNRLRLLGKERADPRFFLMASKLQYEAKEKKWIFTFNNYLRYRYHNLIKPNEKRAILEDLINSDFLEKEIICHEQKDVAFKETFIDQCLRNTSSDIIEYFFIISESFEDFDSQSIADFEERILRLVPSSLLKKILSHSKKFIKDIVFLAFSRRILEIDDAGVTAIFPRLKKLIGDNPEYFRHIQYHLIDYAHKKRRILFSEENVYNDKGAIRYLADLYGFIAEVYMLLGDKQKHASYQVDCIKYNAYLEDKLDTAKKLFEKAINIIKKEHLGAKELYLTCGYMYEYFASLSGDNNKIRYLHFADINYGKANSPRSYLVNILSIINKVKNLSTTSLSKAATESQKALSGNKNLFLNTKKYFETENAVNLLGVISRYGDSTAESLTFLSKTENILANLIMSRNALFSTDEFFISNTKSIINNLDLLIVKNIVQNRDYEYLPEKLHDDSGISEILGDITETRQNENKGSVSISLDVLFKQNKKIVSTELIGAFLKTVCALLNSEGGVINVGILEKSRFKKIPERIIHYSYDDFWIIGVENEYKNYDDCIREIERKIEDNFGKATNSSFVRCQKIKVKDIFIVSIAISDTKKYDYYYNDEYFVRSNAQTIKLSGKEMLDYYSRSILQQ